jgi:hypothetical protein
MIKQLQGTAPDILRDFAEDKYEMVYSFEKPTRRFIDKETGEEYSLSEEVNYYLNEVEFLYANIFGKRQ